MTERSALFLMANLGSEVERVLRAREAGDEGKIVGCLERADRILLELQQSAEMATRLPEIKTLKMVIDDFRNETRQYPVGSEELRGYFTPFALRLLRSA